MKDRVKSASVGSEYGRYGCRRSNWVRLRLVNLDRDEDEILKCITSRRVGKDWEKSGLGWLDLGYVCRREKSMSSRGDEENVTFIRVRSGRTVKGRFKLEKLKTISKRGQDAEKLEWNVLRNYEGLQVWKGR